MIVDAFERPDGEWMDLIERDNYGSDLLDFCAMMSAFRGCDNQGRQWIILDSAFGKYEDN